MPAVDTISFDGTIKGAFQSDDTFLNPESAVPQVERAHLGHHIWSRADIREGVDSQLLDPGAGLSAPPPSIRENATWWYSIHNSRSLAMGKAMRIERRLRLTNVRIRSIVEHL